VTLRTAHLLGPASTPTSRSTPGAPLPGTLASPRTGLAPAGCRELVARLRHGLVSFSIAPELLDALVVAPYQVTGPARVGVGTREPEGRVAGEAARGLRIAPGAVVDRRS